MTASQCVSASVFALLSPSFAFYHLKTEGNRYAHIPALHLTLRKCRVLPTETGEAMAIKIRGQCPLLQVFDMSKSIKFYCDLLGFNIVMTSRPGPQFDWALLRREGAELMLNTAYESDKRPATRDPRWVAAHEDTSIYFGCPNVEGAFQHFNSSWHPR